MNRCETCKHWDDVDAFNGKRPCLKLCGTGKCVEVLSDTGHETPSLETHADFGCVLWEVKE